MIWRCDEEAKAASRLESAFEGGEPTNLFFLFLDLVVFSGCAGAWEAVSTLLARIGSLSWTFVSGWCGVAV